MIPKTAERSLRSLCTFSSKSPVVESHSAGESLGCPEIRFPPWDVVVPFIPSPTLVAQLIAQFKSETNEPKPSGLFRQMNFMILFSSE
jgi:hypothetical protein